MRIISNPLKGQGKVRLSGIVADDICTNPAAAVKLYAKCPVAHVTPMLEMPDLATSMGIGQLYIKDERQRMGLGSFKALGAAFAIAKAADLKLAGGGAEDYKTALKGVTYVCASAGNHGLSLAAGARVFGADAIVYIAQTVPKDFAARLREKGATVIRQGENYEASMEAAKEAAKENNWQLLSDSSWPGYTKPARDVMEGYLIMGAELDEQLNPPPTHIFVQAGVGGLAAALAAAARHYWGNEPRVCVVEPDYAAALIDSIVAEKPVVCEGGVSIMGRLDCKEPSYLALKYLAEEADFFATISEAEAKESVEILSEHGLATTPSGAAGFAAVVFADRFREKLGIDQNSRVLIYLSEGPTDG
jgi:diaminopropionate ammonia-lyase